MPQLSLSAGTPNATNGQSSQSVKSAVRTVELLDYFARNGGTHSLSKLQAALGYPKSSTYVLLQTLVSLGWVETDATGTLYGIGVRALLVGTSYIDGDPIVAAATDVLDWLAEETAETVHLARLDRLDVVYLATRESQHYLRLFSRVGRRLPAHATSLGKALLAEHTDDELRTLLPTSLEALSERTIADRGKFLQEMTRTRKRGYAIDNGENAEGLRCFGVAIRYVTPARDAISCSVPIARLTAKKSAAIVEALLAGRDRLERATRAMYQGR